MITEVRIRNFKCFKSLTIPDLGRITMIGGRNNVGKTALLEALFLFFDRMRADMILRQYGWRGIEGVAAEPDAMWGPLFYNYDMDREIVISVRADGALEEAKFRFNPDFVPPAPAYGGAPPKEQIPTDEQPGRSFSLDIEYTCKDGRKKQLSHLTLDQQGQSGLYIEYQQAGGSRAAFLASKKHIASRNTTNLFSNFVKEGREDEIVQFLQIIEPRLERLTVVTEGPASFVHGKLKGTVRTREIHLMGEGMEKLLNLVLHISSTKGGCVFLDEVENGLHYTGLPNIWEAVGKALRTYNCQLITTTHSYECLKSACEGLSRMPNEFRYIRLDRKDDDISANVLNYEMVATAIETNLEMR